MNYRGTVTSATNDHVYVEIPGLAVGVQFGPCQVLSGPVAVGDFVLCTQIVGALDDIVVVGKLHPKLVSDGAADTPVVMTPIILDTVAEVEPPYGTTNAQPAIGTALFKLGSKGGRLLLRRGLYILSTRIINTKQGSIIEGEGIDATTLLLSAAGFQVGASDVIVRNLTLKANVSNTQQALQAIVTGNFKNWRFENVKFDGLGVTIGRLGSIDANGATLTSTTGLDEHVEFDNCEFTNYTEDGSLSVRGTHSVSVDHCWFHDAGTDTSKGDMLKFSHGATKWEATFCRFERGKRDAIDCFDGHRGSINSCTIDSMGVHGIEMKSASPTATNPADRIRVINNNIINIGTATQSPAIQAATAHIIISNNIVEGGSSYGIRCGKYNNAIDKGHDITIMGNQVLGTAKQGYVAAGTTGLVIMGNIAKNCGVRNFDISSAVNSSVAGTAAMNVSIGGAGADVWP